jgi:hypothetical protein
VKPSASRLPERLSAELEKVFVVVAISASLLMNS